MNFRLFGVPVTIRAVFWLATVLLWGGWGGRAPIEMLPVWVLVVLVSILVHEFGHALAVMRHGLSPTIALHGMGGVTEWDPYGVRVRFRRIDRAIISLAGPFAGFLLGGIVWALRTYALPTALPVLVEAAVWSLVYVNIFWGIVNLMPVLPFDGGNVMAEILGPQRERTTHLVSSIVGAALAVGFMLFGNQLWGALLFGMAAVRSYQIYRLPPGAVLMDPITMGFGPTRTHDAESRPRRGQAPGRPTHREEGPGFFRRLWLRVRLSWVRSRVDGPRRRAGVPPLRIIVGGQSKPPSDKRYLN